MTKYEAATGIINGILDDAQDAMDHGEVARAELLQKIALRKIDERDGMSIEDAGTITKEDIV